MGTIWTPGGERPVGRDEPSQSSPAAGVAGADREPTPEEVEQMVARMQQQLLETPAGVIVRDHIATFYQLSLLHLGQQQPDFDEARLAIDAMAALLDGVNGRIPDEDQLREALGQIRLAYVQVKQAHEGGGEPGAGALDEFPDDTADDTADSTADDPGE